MNSITIVIISSIFHNLIELSLKSTISNCPNVKDVLVVSDKKIKGYGFLNISSHFSLIDYQNFLNKELVNYVKTDYVLIIQPDGMAVDKTMWTNNFLDFDYIGAPFEDLTVGNGGFSLRSKKLLEVLRENFNFNCNTNEDELICKTFRDNLVQNFNIKFADLNLAGLFSREWVLCKNDTFGFHGFWNFPKHFSKDLVFEFILENKEIQNINNFDVLKKHLIRSYDIGFEKSFKMFFNEINNKKCYL